MWIDHSDKNYFSLDLTSTPTAIKVMLIEKKSDPITVDKEELRVDNEGTQRLLLWKWKQI